MNAITTIMKQIDPLFAEQDAKIADSDVAWALGRRQALNDFKTTQEYAELNKRGARGGVYQRMFDICGGKTWYSVFTQNSTAGIEDFMRKNAKTIAEKRNAKIAAKLIKAGVESVETAEVGYCIDGFNGFFKINNDRMVTIESILAGGYNIQRLHQRVLVKVK